MIDVRPAETDEELEAWRQVRLAVLPNEPAATVAEMREMEEPARLLLLAELDGEVAGSGIADRSSTPGHGFVAPRVVPDSRRCGVGAALLRELAAHCAGLGLGRVTGHVEGGDEASLAFAHRFGFEEADRQVEQVIRLAEPSLQVTVCYKESRLRRSRSGPSCSAPPTTSASRASRTWRRRGP